MSDNNDGGPEFPSQHQRVRFVGDDGRLHVQEAAASSGMSLRDWFAGQALAGLAASWITERPGHVEKAAAEAYAMADAMLAARAAKKEAG